MTTTSEEKVLNYFDGNHNCAQSVFQTIVEERKVFIEEVPYISAAFGGGIAGQGKTCGAVTGALMALGLLLKEKEKDITKHKELTNKKAKEFLEQFKEKFETTNCSDIIGFDPNDEASKKKAKEAGRFEELCPKLIQNGVRIVLELVEE
jgi:C_GCAxxG_C_C family probable redox protein